MHCLGRRRVLSAAFRRPSLFIYLFTSPACLLLPKGHSRRPTLCSHYGSLSEPRKPKKSHKAAELADERKCTAHLVSTFITTPLYLHSPDTCLTPLAGILPPTAAASRGSCKEEGASLRQRRHSIHGLPQRGAAGRSGGVDDGADLRGLGHEERPRAGLLHGLLQDPRDAQAEQARALPGKPRRRRRTPRPAAQGGAAPARQGRIRPGCRRPPPATPHRPRRLPHGKEKVPELFPVLYQSLKDCVPCL